MQNLNSIIESSITIIFYLIMAGFIFLSFVAAYSLHRFGESKSIALFINSVYVFLTAALFASAVYYLSQISF